MNNEDAMIQAFETAGIRMDSQAMYSLKEVSEIARSRTNQSRGRLSLEAAGALMDPPVPYWKARELELSALAKMAEGLSDFDGVEFQQ